MKNRLFLYFSVLLISSTLLGLLGCKWQVPEKISVKSNADYNFGAGNLNISLDEALNIKKVMEKGNLPASVKVYDYFPGERNPDTQRYLIKVGLADIPLDLDSIMAQIDLEKNLKAMEFYKKINIPDLSIPSINQSLDTKGISGTIPSGLPGKTLNTNVKFTIENFLPDSSGVESCKIGKGSLGVRINGITLDEGGACNITVSSAGGLTLGNKTVSSGGAVSLDGATLKLGKTDISLAINITGVRSVSSPEVIISPVITELGEVTVDVGSGVKTEFNGSEPLGANVTNIVSAITLGDSGFKVTYTNELPAGNDLKVTAKSDFIGLDKAEIFSGGSVNKTVNFIASGKTVDLAGKNIDFNVKVGLPGNSSSNGSKMVLKNVAMNKTYSIGMKMEPVLKWTEVAIKTGALNNFSKTGTVDLGLELNKILKDLGTKFGDPDLFTKLEIKKLPVYIFCGKPVGIAGLDNLKFKASAKLYLNSPGNSVGDLLPETDDIGFAEIPKIKNSEIVVTQDLNALQKSVTRDLGEAFTKIIQKPGRLGLEYKVSAKGATGDGSIIKIKESELKGSSKISLEAYIDFGLVLNVPRGLSGEGIKINLAKMESFKKFVGRDILNGAGKSIKDKGTDAYLSAVKRVAVKCDVKALPFVTSRPISFVMKSNVGDWNLNLGQGSSLDIALTHDQVESLFNNTTKNPNYEFKVDTMTVTLPDGEFTIPRGKQVNTNLYLNLVTDGTVKIWENGQNNGGGK